MSDLTPERLAYMTAHLDRPTLDELRALLAR